MHLLAWVIILEGLCSTVGTTPPAVPERPSVLEDTSFSNMEQKTRDAAVKVWPLDQKGYGSGTYFRLGGIDFILTAAHVTENDYLDIMLVEERSTGEGKVLVLGEVVYEDAEGDIAIIRLSAPLQSRTPLRFRPRTSRLLGSDIFYTGFPNGNDLLTLRGRIAGPAYGGRRYFAQSYTWFGASGSGVFDAQGHIIGVLTGMDAYQDLQGGFSLPAEDLVSISPISTLPRETLRNALHAPEGEVRVDDVLKSMGLEASPALE